jgi:hypothetical protein
VDNEIFGLLVVFAGLRPLPPVREQGVKWVLIEVVLIKVGAYSGGRLL